MLMVNGVSRLPQFSSSDSQAVTSEPMQILGLLSASKISLSAPLQNAQVPRSFLLWDCHVAEYLQPEFSCWSSLLQSFTVVGPPLDDPITALWVIYLAVSGLLLNHDPTSILLYFMLPNHERVRGLGLANLPYSGVCYYVRMLLRR